MPPDILKSEIQKVKQRTNKPFGVNIMLMSPFVKEVMQVVVDEKVPVVTTGYPEKLSARMAGINL